MTLDDRLKSHLGRKPVLSESLFIAASATVVGDVELGRGIERVLRRGAPGRHQLDTGGEGQQHPGQRGRPPG